MTESQTSLEKARYHLQLAQKEQETQLKIIAQMERDTKIYLIAMTILGIIFIALLLLRIIILIG